MKKVLIGNKSVGKGQPTYIIAEAGSNHDGKLKQAKELIDVAAAAGANAVKFQLFKAEEIAAQTKNEIAKLDNGKTLYNFYKSLEFARDWLGELNDYSKERGIEFMGTMASHYDLARFGMERVSFSPRQADMLMVMGTISKKMGPILRQVYEQMAEPRWVIAVGACASSGGIFDTYSVLQGIDKVIPVDVYIPGCPPRPEALLHALISLQDKIKMGMTREQIKQSV